MKKKIIVWGVVVFLALTLPGCIKDNMWYSGTSNGKHDCTLLEYLEKDSYNWDSTALMVRHAGQDVVRLFNGEDPAHPEITFFGPTNHSIRRYMLDSLNNHLKRRINRVDELDPAWCRDMLLRHVVKGIVKRDNFPPGKPGIVGAATGEGGKIYTTLGGNRIFAFSRKEAYEGVEEMGPLTIYLYSLDNPKGSKDLGTLASTDIEPRNCVVHSLQYYYTLGEM